MTSDPTRLVLLVEDDAAAAEALLLILRDWGAEVIHGLGGDALAAANGRLNEVRWIITDFNLGKGEDGISLVKRLRTAAPAARVLVLSGSFTGRATAEAAQAGFDVMQKPARAKSIIEWLERA
ncbi:MAG TPA: response regulator [Vitreimonas sp.]|nr:response regulator [Vitreimonas sp.]